MNSSTLPLNTTRSIKEIEQHRLAVRRNPRDANAHALLGVLLLKARHLEEGATAVRRALELNPKMRDMQAVLATALFELGQYEAAVEAFRTALRFQDAAYLHQGLADALRLLRRFKEAEPGARRALELEPDNTAFLLSLAAVLNGQERLEDTLALIRRVSALEPGNADAWRDQARLLMRLSRHEEAIAAYRELTGLRPDDVQAYRDMAVCQQRAGQTEAALDSYVRALELEPDHANTLCDYGSTTHRLGKLAEAAVILQRALAIEPDNVLVLRALLHTTFSLGEWREALRLARHLLAVEPTPEHHSIVLFILSHCCFDGAELTREHFSFGERWEPALLASRQPHPNDRDPARRIRIGIVSGDLYNHAVSHFVAPVFEAMKESSQVSLYIYYNNSIEDESTARHRANACAWRPIHGVDDALAERMIRADAIDILIDLSGHSALNRLPLFARKPAPVQATWLGYAGTTGLRAMDYVLCDRFIVPKGRYDDQFSEQIVRLPLGAAFLPHGDAPDVNASPAQKNGYLTFGSFHRASKLSREVIAQWARLLHAVPDAMMLLGGLRGGVDDVLVDWFKAEGIPRERLMLRPHTHVHGYLAQHHEVDICLSPFPYTGSTTVGHALWMGVPTLATVGTTNPSHAAAVFMAHLGLGTFITEDEDTYIKLGVFLSQNTSALATMRATMRDRFLNSILGYPGVAAAGMELGLRRMWQRWCADEAAAPLQVELSDLMPATEDGNA